MPRRSAAAKLLAVAVDGGPPRLTVPAGLKPAERILFEELVNAVAAEHFLPADTSLIVSYVQATLLAHSTAGHPDQVAVWEKACRLQMALATKLRLTPQSRTDPKTLGRMEVRRYPPPWEIGKDEEE
jgi:hypothetical protein